MQKTIKLFIIVAVVILILVVILFALIGVKNNKSPIKNSAENNSSSKEVVDIAVDDAIKNIPKSYENDASFQKCAVRQVNMCIEKSVRKKVKDGGGIELCDDYLTNEMKDNCRTGFILKTAVESGNVAECDLINDENSKTSCVLEVSFAGAVKNKSLDICNGLEEDVKKKCVTKAATKLALTLKDVAWCENIGEVEQKRCKRGVENAIENENRRNQEKENRQKEEQKRQEVKKQQQEETNNKVDEKKEVGAE